MGSKLSLTNSTQIGRRSNSRLRLNVPATLVLVDGHWSSVLENVSKTGARLSIDQPVRVGSAGFLRCQKLELFGAVIWSRGGRCGIRFDEFLGDRDMMSLRWFGEHYYQIDADQRRNDVRDWVGGKRRHL